MRDNYQLKDNHSGRVCEGHYRRDLRSFKRNYLSFAINIVGKHSVATPKKSLDTSPIHSSRKHQLMSSSPPNVMDEPLYHDHGIPHSYLYYSKPYYVPQRSSWLTEPAPLYTEQYSSGEEYEPSARAPLPASQIFMEVDEASYDEDEEDDLESADMHIDDSPPTKIRKTVLPSISQLYSTPSPSTLYHPTFETFHPPPIQQSHHCGLEPLSQSMHDTKFKAFCDFVLKNESWVSTI